MIVHAVFAALLAIAWAYRAEMLYDIDEYADTFKLQLNVAANVITPGNGDVEMAEIYSDMENNVPTKLPAGTSLSNLRIRLPFDIRVRSVTQPGLQGALGISTHFSVSRGILTVDEPTRSLTVNMEGRIAPTVHQASAQALHSAAMWSDMDGIIGATYNWAAAISTPLTSIHVSVRHASSRTLISSYSVAVAESQVFRRLRLREAKQSSFMVEDARLSTYFLLLPHTPAVVGDYTLYLRSQDRSEAFDHAIEVAHRTVLNPAASTVVVCRNAFNMRRAFPATVAFAESTSEHDVLESIAFSALARRAEDASVEDYFAISALAIVFTTQLHKLPVDRHCAALATDSHGHRKPLAVANTDEAAAIKLALLVGPHMQVEIETAPLTLADLLEQTGEPLDTIWLNAAGYPLVHVDLEPGQSPRFKITQKAFPALVHGDYHSNWPIEIKVELEGREAECQRLGNKALEIPFPYTLEMRMPSSLSMTPPPMERPRSVPLKTSRNTRMSRDEIALGERSESTPSFTKRRKLPRAIEKSVEVSEDCDDSEKSTSFKSDADSMHGHSSEFLSTVVKMEPILLSFARVVYSSNVLRSGVLNVASAPLQILDDAVAAFLWRDIGLESLLDTIALVLPSISRDDAAAWEFVHARITSVHLATEGDDDSVKATISLAIGNILTHCIAPGSVRDLRIFENTSKNVSAVTIFAMLLEVGEQRAVSYAQDLFNDWRTTRPSFGDEETLESDIVKAFMRAAEIYGNEGDFFEVAHLRNGWRQRGDTLPERIRRHYATKLSTGLALLSTPPDEIILSIPSAVRGTVVWLYVFFKMRLFSSWWSILKNVSMSVALTAPFWHEWDEFQMHGLSKVGLEYKCDPFVDGSYGAMPWIILVGFRYALYLWIGLQFVYFKDSQDALVLSMKERKAIEAPRRPWLVKRANPAFWHRGTVKYDQRTRERIDSYSTRVEESESSSDPED